MRKTLLFSLIVFPFCLWAQELKFPPLQARKSEGKAQIFTRDNVYGHINGASEFYLSYGFETLHVGNWNNQGAELTIEVYDQGDPLHAYGIYSIEKSAKAETHPVGLEGYGDASTYNFVAGKFYVKMNGMQLEKVSGFSLKSVAEEFSATLCEKPEYPKIIGMFPGENQVANSCQYIPTEFMGMVFLGSAAMAKYYLMGEEFTIFIIERSDRGEVEKIVTKYIGFAETKNKKPAEGDYLLEDPFNGTVFLRWKGNYLIGASGFSDQKKVISLLDQISGKL